MLDAKTIQAQCQGNILSWERGRHLHLASCPVPCQRQLNTIRKLEATSQTPKARDLLAAMGRMVCKRRAKGMRPKQGGRNCFGGQG